MNSPDSAATAIVYTERAKQSQDLARQHRAFAETVMQAEDRDDLDGDLRRHVYRLALGIADAYERHSDDCRERAYSAQQSVIRRAAS